MLVFWSLFPVITFLIFYKFQSAKKIESPLEAVVDLNAASEGINESQLSELRNARYWAIFRNSSRIQKQYGKKWGRAFVTLCSVSWILIVVNGAKGFVPAWYILIFIGLSGSLLAYWDTIIHKIVLEYEDSLLPPNERGKNESRKKNLLEAKNISIFLLVGTLVVSANWAWQVNNNMNRTKQAAVNDVLSLVGSSWCNKFANYDMTSEGDSTNSGGWPCITVGSISNITYSKKGKDPVMCADFSFDKDSGTPEQEQIIKSYESKTVCSFEDWSKTSFTDSVFPLIEQELPALNTELCRIYSSSISEADRNIYC
jgi:hypothetical protein